MMKKNTVSILDFGAVPDGEELLTEKIQAAIDHCFLQGGGEVVIPAGVFHTGGIRLRSNITLHLLSGAVLKGSRNPDDYFGYLHDELEPLPAEQITDCLWTKATRGGKPRDYRFLRLPGSRWNNGLIKAVYAENVAIIGEEGSVIDGSDCFDELGEEHYRGPHAINMFYCRNLTFRGYRVVDSANWAHAIAFSQNIRMENVTVEAGHDGIHCTVCENIRIANSNFYTGDDCVAGFANMNVTVTGCELNSACSALRFGGTNVLIENCHMYGPCRYLFRGSLTPEEKREGIRPSTEGHRNNMLSVFTYYSDFSVPVAYQPGNILLRNCRVDYADRFLHFNFFGNEPWQQNRPLESIRFENIKATDISMPLTAYGDAATPVTVELRNLEVSLRQGFEDIDFMRVAHYKKIVMENVKIENFAGKALIKAWTEGDVEITGLVCDVKDENRVVLTDEEFVCKAI